MRVEPLGDLDTECHLLIDRYNQAIDAEISRGDRAVIEMQEAWTRRRERLLRSKAKVHAATMPVIGLPKILIEFAEDPDILRIAAKLAPASRGDEERTEADEERQVANG